MPLSPSRVLSRALAALMPSIDIVRERSITRDPPRFCELRAWTPFLTNLSEGALADCELRGLALHLKDRGDAPPSLSALAAEVRAVVTCVSPLHAASDEAMSAQNIKARKGMQLAPLLAALRPIARDAARVVDVGSGSGHLTRLAAERFARDALGIERDAARVSFATTLAEGTRATFELRDALDGPWSLREDDLVVGLHACGELGDRIAREAGAAGASLGLVSCCLQKIRDAQRAPLSRAAREAGMVLPREILGLSNVSERAMGVEASLAENLASRQARYALARLLRARGVELDAAEAMRGINRRRAHHGLAALAQTACALRGLDPPTGAELREHERAAAGEFMRVRSCSLPRVMLARVLEIAVVCDRAASLEERGREVRVHTVFAAGVSPRNLGIFAKRSDRSGR